jgi:hypothetical protein
MKLSSIVPRAPFHTSSIEVLGSVLTRNKSMPCGPASMTVNPRLSTPLIAAGCTLLTHHDVDGTSGINDAEAAKLFNATVSAPLADDVYLVELQVIHDLHCLNMLRKVAYPDQYPEMWDHFENGTVNHNTLQSLHIGQCSPSR